MKFSRSLPSATSRALIYGPPKTGKSQLAGELAAAGFNILWFDLEKGSSVLRKLPIEAQERIELVALPDTRSYPIAIETCLKVIKGNECKICEAHGKVGCMICNKSGAPYVVVNLSTLDSNTIVVFDSLTQLVNSAIAHITKSQPDDYRLTFDDWGNLGKLMDIFLSHVQQAGFNVICISHETEAELEDGKMKIVPVAGTRNFSRNSAKYFDHVVYAQVKNGKHRFSSSTTAESNIVVGSRTDFALEKMSEFSLASLFTASAKVEPAAKSDNVVTIASAQTNGQVAANQLTGILAKHLAEKKGA